MRTSSSRPRSSIAVRMANSWCLRPVDCRTAIRTRTPSGPTATRCICSTTSDCRPAVLQTATQPHEPRPRKQRASRLFRFSRRLFCSTVDNRLIGPALDVLKGKTAMEMLYRDVDRTVSRRQAAEILGKSLRWVDELGRRKQIVRQSGLGTRARGYSLRSIRQYQADSAAK